MKIEEKPVFYLRKNNQKSGMTGRYFTDEVTDTVLQDVCLRITGQSEFEKQLDDSEYNKGRLAVLVYRNVAHYITFSPVGYDGRNSSVQSAPTAYNQSLLCPYPCKYYYYYFLAGAGERATEYQLMMYRLLRTIGFNFLNPGDSLGRQIAPFVSVDDIILHRRTNAGRNSGNNSTFITKNDQDEIEVYGKTYGANKYESSLFCYALAKVRSPGQLIRLFEMVEGDLSQLPQASRAVLEQLGNIYIVTTGKELERKCFFQNDSLRSPHYTLSLYQKLGNKRCALCDCGIQELVQGAHIWPVAAIKNEQSLSMEQKLLCATDGENGLWLCENHHKLFDTGMLGFNTAGQVWVNSQLDTESVAYIQEITKYRELPLAWMTPRFQRYLLLRGQLMR